MSSFGQAAWFETEETNAGLEYRFPCGTLTEQMWLTADYLVDSKYLVVFVLFIQAGKGGGEFALKYNTLNQVQSRIRLPLQALDQNKWLLGRKGPGLSHGAAVTWLILPRLTACAW